MEDEIIPLVVVLDGERMHPDATQYPSGDRSLYGQWGDWNHVRSIPGGWDFTTVPRSSVERAVPDKVGSRWVHQWVQP